MIPLEAAVTVHKTKFTMHNPLTINKSNYVGSGLTATCL